MLIGAPPGGDGVLEIVGVHKSFGNNAILHGIDLRVATGEFVSLVGPSGCGKTTTLNIVAGFTSPDRGDVRLGGRSVTNMPPHRRDLGMVFQSHALFPHMTLAENVGFGLAMRRMPKPEIRRRVAEALDMVRLGGFEKRYPRELSGGQQQRVGLARALTAQPRVVLLDEPLSSLDAKLRREMQIELRRIQRLVNITAVYVTHDQEEALTLSDRIVVMNQGRIEQIGTPEEVYTRPATEFVVGFIGEASFFDGAVLANDGAAATVELEGGSRIELDASPDVLERVRLRLAIRPDRVALSPLGQDMVPKGCLAGTLTSRAFIGPALRCVVDLGAGRQIQAEVPISIGGTIEVGGRVAIRIAPADWLVVAASDRRS